MKKFLLFIVLFFISADKKPIIRVNSTTYDFGFGLEGEYYLYRTYIYNDGNANLKIDRVRSSCHCTSAPLEKKLVKPGDSVYLDLIFNTHEYYGEKKRRGIIYSNDEQTPVTTVGFRIVLADRYYIPLAVNPMTIDLSSIDSLSPQTSIDIYNGTLEPCSLKVINVFGDVIRDAYLDNEVLNSKDTVKLHVILKPRFKLNDKGSITLWLYYYKDERVLRFSIPLSSHKRAYEGEGDLIK